MGSIPLLLGLAVLLLLSPSAVEAGEVIAWGYDEYGQGTVPPEAESGVTAIATGTLHSLALTEAGEVIAWGQNSDGECTVPPAAQSDVTAIAAGWGHSLALTGAGEVIAWGGDFEGQVSNAPTGTGFIAIAAGWNHSLALTSAGEVIAWGWNGYNLISDAPTGTGFTAIAAGYDHSLALTGAGGVIAWGHNLHGQINIPLEAESGVIAIAGGHGHSLALTEAGEVIAWGRNDWDQVSGAPQETGVIAIATGGFHSLALLALQADFSGSPTGGTAPLTVSFTDLSTNSPTAWQWEFGDGGASSEQHPSHTYLLGGGYTPSLTATNADGSATETKAGYISVTAVAPVADFFGNPTSGPVPLTVYFTDQSTNSPIWWNWDFGDTGTSSLQHPSHDYTSTGQFAVSLTAANGAGWDTETKTDYISVTEVPPPVAEFSGSPTSGAAPLTVQFADLSTNSPTAWEWDFGDGGTDTVQNPSYTYVLAGTYTPSMTATNASGSDTAMKSRYIVVNFVDVGEENWAYGEIMACVEADIVAGYPDGAYQPDGPVNRAEMAAYISRALAGGEQNVPEGPAEPTFGDVAADHWAYKYVEHCVTNGIVQGYWDGYHPGEMVNRAQMAAFIARSMATPTGEAGLVGYDPPASPTFPDVPNTSAGSRGLVDPFWAYKHIEYCVENGVVAGYLDGSYHPEYVVTRDQMAVYVARAFGLAM